MARVMRALLTIVLLGMVAGAPARAAIPTGNLLVNGDAEAGAGSSDATTTAPVPIPGWLTTANFTEHTYDPAGSGLFPDATVTAAIGGGRQFFAGGPENGGGNTVETAAQIVDVSGAASEIDTGSVSAGLFADLGGFADQEDAATVTAVFLGSQGQQLGQLGIGPVTAADRHDTTGLLPRSGSAFVPRGTRQVRVVITATKSSGAYSDAYLDNVSLTLVPAPTLGRTVDVAPVSGQVFVKLPGGAAHDALAKGSQFVPLTEARQLPTGSQIDARAGSLRLIAASSRPGKPQTAVLGGGLFGLTQARTGLRKGLTTFSLIEGGFRGAPSRASCPKRASDRPSTVAHTAISKRVLQTLHARVHGRFRTRGRYSAGTVRGTVWDTIERCDGTLTVVHRGTVVVTAFGPRKTIAVHAGQELLATRHSAIRRRLTHSVDRRFG